jgi:hypothetical protein
MGPACLFGVDGATPSVPSALGVRLAFAWLMPVEIDRGCWEASVSDLHAVHLRTSEDLERLRRQGRRKRFVESEHVGFVQTEVKRGPVLADIGDGSRLGNCAHSVVGENPGERHARWTYPVSPGDASHDSVGVRIRREPVPRRPVHAVRQSASRGERGTERRGAGATRRSSRPEREPRPLRDVGRLPRVGRVRDRQGARSGCQRHCERVRRRDGVPATADAIMSAAMAELS